MSSNSNGVDPRLLEYRRKRNFRKTTEPAGAGHVPFLHRFSVQEHHASRLHWDLRIEMDGVLKSWAIPKGIPSEPGVKRLAVQTEDHPVDYINFEGVIPEGEYGAGTVSLWDEGTYTLEHRDEKKIILTLNGKKLQGRYVLINTRQNQWILFLSSPKEKPTR